MQGGQESLTKLPWYTSIQPLELLHNSFSTQSSVGSTGPSSELRSGVTRWETRYVRRPHTRHVTVMKRVSSAVGEPDKGMALLRLLRVTSGCA